MHWRRAVLASVVACTIATPVPAMAGNSAPPASSIKVTAGAVAEIKLRSFVPVSDKQPLAEVLGVSAGDHAGVALVGRNAWAIQVSTAKVGCRFRAECIEIPFGHAFGSDQEGKARGVPAGVYSLVVLGRPGAQLSLRWGKGLAAGSPRFRGKARVQVRELRQQYPSGPDAMPEAYFDEQLDGPSGRAVTVLIGHLDAGRPKTLQFSSCLRHGSLPALHIPRYGGGCVGEDGPEAPGGATGGMSVGGQDCSVAPAPVCLPLATESAHVSFAFGQVFSRPPHVSMSADITALQSHVRATTVTSTLP